MFRHKWFSLLFSTMLITQTVLADQAAYISRTDAERAMQLLNHISTVKFYCAPCNDKAATQVSIRSINGMDVNYQGYWEVQINGEGIDLAYTYFPDGKRWRNVAMALHIQVQDVPEFID